MTHLRKMMLEELQRRNYAANTIHAYLRSVEHFSRHFKRSPDQLTRDHLREYQAYLLNDRKLQPRTVKLRVSALRFFFVKTLKRRYLLEDMPYPKVPRRLPTILTVEEVTPQIVRLRMHGSVLLSGPGVLNEWPNRKFIKNLENRYDARLEGVIVYDRAKQKITRWDLATRSRSFRR